jgi:hypothetical protein
VMKSRRLMCPQIEGPSLAYRRRADTALCITAKSTGKWTLRVIFVRSTRFRRSRHVRFAPIASEPSHRSESMRQRSVSHPRSSVCRLIANHLHLAFFESTPEVRVLPSTSITRLQWSYDPVRLPPMPPPEATLRPLPSHQTGLPRLPEPPFRRAVPTTPADRAGALVDCFPASRGLPPMAGESATALLLSAFRPAQASLTLRPAGSLSRLKATFVTRLRPMRLPARAARQLPD